MSDGNMTTLQDLQKLDEEIRKVRERIQALDEELAGAEEPLMEVQKEAEATRERLTQMKVDERRLESSADEKRARAKKLDDRMEQVRNLREEVAVRAELDIVRRAVEADEQEALGLLDQIRRTEDTLEELEGRVDEAQAELEPRRQELAQERARQEEFLHELTGRREDYVDQIGEGERRVYESFRSSGRSVVVAQLLEDGACGHCFGMVPLQVQNEIRGGAKMVRCEACGVILTPPNGGGDATGSSDG